jgi:hypothetical protein
MVKGYIVSFFLYSDLKFYLFFQADGSIAQKCVCVYISGVGPSVIVIKKDY